MSNNITINFEKLPAFKARPGLDWTRRMGDAQDDWLTAAVVKYADRWARLMQAVIDHTGASVAQVATWASHQADDVHNSISGGGLYGAASELSIYWIYGEELADWYERSATPLTFKASKELVDMLRDPSRWGLSLQLGHSESPN